MMIIITMTTIYIYISSPSRHSPYTTWEAKKILLPTEMPRDLIFWSRGLLEDCRQLRFHMVCLGLCDLDMSWKTMVKLGEWLRKRQPFLMQFQ